MKIQIFLITVLLCIFMQTTYSASCGVSTAEEQQLLIMSYDDFDQRENGWRQYTKIGCYHEMGVLIDKYLDQNKISLKDWQLLGVTWHAGQMYAFNNEYAVANIRFDHSLNPNEPENAPILWNDYVYATIAFLNNDRPGLIRYRDKISNGKVMNGKIPNLDVVDNLIRYYGQPYSIAYHPNK